MKDTIYLDYCATTPVHSEVKDAMVNMLEIYYGNPSSMHQVGAEAKQHLEKARLQVADGIGCDPGEVNFTSGATESDNLALFGVLRQFEPGEAHLITSSIEHHAVLHAAHQLKREGHLITVLPVDSLGVVDPDDVRRAIRPETKLVSIMMVNNEVGSIQNLEEIGQITAAHEVLFHTDAVQGVGYLDINVDNWHIDMLSLSAHKIFGPKGVGALFVRKGVQLSPLLHGGSQEGGQRPGTENMPGIVALGAAMKIVEQKKPRERDRLSALRTWFGKQLTAEIPGIKINGPVNCSPHILSASFPEAIAEMMQIHLNRDHIAVSLGSACTSKDVEPSHVLVAMGLPHDQIEATIRFSFGYPTTQETLSKVCEVLPEAWQRSIMK